MQVFFKEYLESGSEKNRLSSVFHYDHASKGSILALITINSEADLDASNVSRFIWNSIVEEFNYNDNDTIEVMKESLRLSETKLLQLIKNHKESEKSGVELDIALVAFHETTLYFALYSDLNIDIIHEGDLVRITEILRENRVSSGSTTVNADDIVVLSSGDTFVKTIGEIEEPLSPNVILDAVKVVDIPEGEGMVLGSLTDFFKFEKDKPVLTEDEDVAEIDSEPDTTSIKGKLKTSSLAMEAETRDQEESDIVEELIDEPTEEEQDGSVDKTNEDIVSKPREKDIFDEVVIDSPASKPAYSVNQAVDSGNEAQGEVVSTSKKALPNDIWFKVTAFLTLAVVKLKSLFNKESVEGIKQKSSKYTENVSNSVGAFSTKMDPLKRKASSTTSAAYSKSTSKVSGYVNTKYGRNPKVKRFMARISQSRVNSPKIRGVKIDHYQDKSLRNRRFTIVALVIVVFALGFLGYRATQNAKLANEISDSYNSMESKTLTYLDEAETKLRSDSSAAELALFNANKTLDSFTYSVDELNEEDKKSYNELENRILVFTDKLNKTVALSEDSENIELFLDGRLAFGKNSSIGDIAIFRNTLFEEELYLTDKNGPNVYKVSTQDAESRAIPGGDDLDSPEYISIGETGLFVYDSVLGIAVADFGQNNAEFSPFRVLTGLSPQDFGSGGIAEFEVFTINDNVYALSKQDRAVYKSNRTESGTYTLPFIYVEENSFSSAEDILADFDIYVLTGGSSGLNRFTYSFASASLEPNPISVSGMKTDFQNLVAGYTGSDLNYGFYVFDAEGSRILTFEKPIPGEDLHPTEMLYQKQYIYRGSKDGVFSNVKDIVVDAEERYMYVLDGNQIWRVTL